MDEITKNLFGMGGNPDDDKARLNRELLEHIRSKNSKDVMQNSDLSKNDMYSMMALEILDSVIGSKFITNKNQRNFIREAIDRLYLVRVSLNRQGRKEMFDSMRNETNYMMMNEMKKDGQVKI